jgi:hypothetical protein
MLLQDKYHQKLTSLFDSHNSLRSQIEQYKDFPTEIADWLGRLKLLYGVPLNYLVPDERMLPPESIRFFYIDLNWIKALLDGAFSIGRGSDPEKTTRSFRMDSASTPLMGEESKQKASAVRAKYLGLVAPKMDMTVLSGFLLRSSVVADYPGLGMNVYPKGQTPSGEDPGTQLNILRMERLTPAADVLLCIIEGDAYRVDIHEAPEALHYGIDSYTNDGCNITGKKDAYRFTKDSALGNQSVTMDTDHPVEITLSLETIFRKSNGGRTVNMANLAAMIGEKTSPGATLDASEMGFEMIEGVGMVKFYNEKGEL